MPDLASPMQPGATIIEIRPFRGSWPCPDVQPYWTGDTAKEDAIGYATTRAKFGRGEIRVLKFDRSIEHVIGFNQPHVHG